MIEEDVMLWLTANCHSEETKICLSEQFEHSTSDGSTSKSETKIYVGTNSQTHKENKQLHPSKYSMGI